MRRFVLLFAALLAVPAEAADFMVDSAVDAVDANPGDGICADATGVCTLRAAVMETNALPGQDTIYVPAGTYRLNWVHSPDISLGSIHIRDGLRLVGAGRESTIVDAAGGGRAFYAGPSVSSPAPTTIMIGLTITGGDSIPLIASGGAIGANGTELQVVDARITGNAGPAIDAIGGATSVFRTQITQNHGISQQPGTLRLESSVVAEDGPIYIDGCVSGKMGCLYCEPASLAVVNSTISGGTGILGAIVIGPSGCGGTLYLVQSTVTGNSGGGIVEFFPDSTAFLRGSIIANQTWGPNCSLPLGGGNLVSKGHNLDSDGTCGLTDPTDLPNRDPLLGPLQDNGGPTWTHALLPGSPAIDAIPVADCTWDDDGDPGTPEVPLATDQRGEPRPVGTGCDIGAFEAVPEPGQAWLAATGALMLLLASRQRLLRTHNSRRSESDRQTEEMLHEQNRLFEEFPDTETHRDPQP